MKTSEFRKLIQEEIKAVLNEKTSSAYEKDILTYLSNQKKSWIKIDDLRISLLAPKSSKETSFDVAWKKLVKDKKLELLGNSVRLK